MSWPLIGQNASAWPLIGSPDHSSLLAPPESLTRVFVPHPGWAESRSRPEISSGITGCSLLRSDGEKLINAGVSALISLGLRSQCKISSHDCVQHRPPPICWGQGRPGVNTPSFSRQSSPRQNHSGACCQYSPWEPGRSWQLGAQL